MEPQDSVVFEYKVTYRGRVADEVTLFGPANLNPDEQAKALEQVADSLAHALVHAQEQWAKAHEAEVAELSGRN